LAVTCFNLTAKLKGGISTDFVLLRPERQQEVTADPSLRA
jgi:hypothetical protein